MLNIILDALNYLSWHDYTVYWLTKQLDMKKLIPVIALSLIIGSSCNNAEKQANERRIDSLEQAIATQRVIDSMNEAMAMQAAAEEEARAISIPPPQSSGRRSGSSNHYSSTTTNNYNTTTQPSTATSTTQKKKGWSSTAKGAVIGTGVGALTGALVSDQKGKGAIIGGVIGAGAGAGTGLIIDKSKQKREREAEEERRRLEEENR